MYVQKRKEVNKMDGKAFKKAVDLLSKEKKIDEDIIYDAMELALTSAYKKNYHSLPNVRVDINRETGEIHIYSFKTVVEKNEYDDKMFWNWETINDSPTEDEKELKDKWLARELEIEEYRQEQLKRGLEMFCENIERLRW